MVNTTLLSCFGIGDSIVIFLEYERIESWRDIVGIYNNGYDRNEYLILHNDTTFTHIYYSNPGNIKFSRGIVNFCLNSKDYSHIYYDNWEYYGNYINEGRKYLRPEDIVNNHTLRCGCIDDMEFDFHKLDRTEQYLIQFNCKIESAFSSAKEKEGHFLFLHKKLKPNAHESKNTWRNIKNE